ncbi:hypothetical protein JSMCR1_1362 [Escherichia coli]|nr:hypothetical protein JSMCR1_1362 [Escherichia coli]
MPYSYRYTTTNYSFNFFSLPMILIVIQPKLYLILAVKSAITKQG